SLGQADRLSDVVAHILDHDAKPAAINRAGRLELTYDLLDQRCGHREGDANITARRREDGGVDADHLAVEIEGGAARVAAVHRSVNLEVVVGARADVAVMGRDDAGRHRAAETERITDGEHPIADAWVLLRELDIRKRLALGLDLDQRDV